MLVMPVISIRHCLGRHPGLLPSIFPVVAGLHLPHSVDIFPLVTCQFHFYTPDKCFNVWQSILLLYFLVCSRHRYSPFFCYDRTINTPEYIPFKCRQLLIAYDLYYASHFLSTSYQWHTHELSTRRDIVLKRRTRINRRTFFFVQP